MKKLSGLFGVLALMTIAPLVHADYEITYQVGLGGIQSCIDNPDSTNTSGTNTCSQTTGGVQLTAAGGSSNSPGVVAGADELSSIATVTNNNSVTTTITLWYLAQGFSLPATGGSVSGIKYVSNASGSEVGFGGGSGGSTLDLTSCVDEGAGGMGATFCGSPAASLTNPTVTVPTTGVGDNTVVEVFSPLSASYALEQKVTLVLEAGDSINISLSQILTPVPEPASIALLGGLILLASGAIRRKRRQEASRS